jgi:hypothetical protein
MERTDSYADVNGVRLHYVSAGKGKLILFVACALDHRLTASSTSGFFTGMVGGVNPVADRPI